MQDHVKSLHEAAVIAYCMRMLPIARNFLTVPSILIGILSTVGNGKSLPKASNFEIFRLITAIYFELSYLFFVYFSYTNRNEFQQIRHEMQLVGCVTLFSVGPTRVNDFFCVIIAAFKACKLRFFVKKQEIRQATVVPECELVDVPTTQIKFKTILQPQEVLPVIEVIMGNKDEEVKKK